MDNILPSLAVVTVTYNCADSIEATINSVLSQDYPNIEYIIIDGGSTDGTVDIIKKYEDTICYWISEPDKGIYDAMNKGIQVAMSCWINFMNAGDVFYSEKSITDAISGVDLDVSFIYSDFYSNRKNKLRLIHASFKEGILLHQSVIYKKELHLKYGNYLVTDNYIISDYFFFQLLAKERMRKSSTPISVNSTPGISGGNWTWNQKMCVDYIFNRMSTRQLLFSLIARSIKNFVILCIKKIGR